MFVVGLRTLEDTGVSLPSVKVPVGRLVLGFEAARGGSSSFGSALCLRLLNSSNLYEMALGPT